MSVSQKTCFRKSMEFRWVGGLRRLLSEQKYVPWIHLSMGVYTARLPFRSTEKNEKLWLTLFIDKEILFQKVVYILHNNLKTHKLHGPASIWEHQNNKVVTKTTLYTRHGEILFQKVALGYLLHFAQNGSYIKHLLEHLGLHNNLKNLKIIKYTIAIYPQQQFMRPYGASYVCCAFDSFELCFGPTSIWEHQQT